MNTEVPASEGPFSATSNAMSTLAVELPQYKNVVVGPEMLSSKKPAPKDANSKLPSTVAPTSNDTGNASTVVVPSVAMGSNS